MQSMETTLDRIAQMQDDYLRERKADLEQVVERLLSAMARGPSNSFAPARSAAPDPRDFAGEDPLVLIANDIAPADMLQFKRSVFTGFITDVGGKTSHTAIVARSLDIPAVVGARDGAAHSFHDQLALFIIKCDAALDFRTDVRLLRKMQPDGWASSPSTSLGITSFLG